MRILGIDYGTKRIGIALTDESGEFAIPKEVIANDKNTFQRLKDIIEENEVAEIVMGESKDFQGKDNTIMEAVHVLKKRLESEIKLPVYFEPEFMTSQEAEKLQGKTGMLDASAAAIILRSYIQRKK